MGDCGQVGLVEEVENEMAAEVREEEGERPKDFCNCGLDYTHTHIYIYVEVKQEEQNCRNRHTLGDKTLNARFGGGDDATAVFDFALAGEVI